MADRLAIEFISGMAMPPPDFVAMVAGLGVSRIGLAPAPITGNPHGYPAWNLADDPALVRETRDALAASGVSVAIGEGFLIRPGSDVSGCERLVDMMAGLGASRINAVVIEPDRARAADQFAELAGLAAARDMATTLEFMPLMWPATVAEALALVEASGAPRGELLLDAMHVYRSGADDAGLRSIPPQRIGHVQICDVPLPARNPDYGDEARNDRLCPGDGDLPLGAFLRALPANLTVGLEVPHLPLAQRGLLPREVLARCVATARDLLDQVASA